MNTDSKPESSLGYVETDGPDGNKRLYVAAIFGDGGLILGHGDWGHLGMVQILAAAKPKELGPIARPGSPEHAAMVANIDEQPGVMLLFKTKADVERLMDTLRELIAVFPKMSQDGGQ